MPAARYPRHAMGFTLVELLLALTLMSMLMALAYGGLRASTRAVEKGQTVLEDSGRVRMAHQFIRKQLNQMIPLVFEETEDQTVRTVFEGDSQRIRFVAPMPGYLGFGGPQVQELAIVRGDEADQLVFVHALLQGFEEQHLYERDPIVLIEQIDKAEFSFIGLDDYGDPTDWMNSWEEPQFLPKSVSLSIEFDEAVYIQWPLLIAAVRIDAEGLTELAPGMSRDTLLRTSVGKKPSTEEGQQ